MRWVTSPIRSPQRALAGAGTAVKTATIGAGTAYVGWQALVNEKPIVETVGETLVGKETNEAIKEGVHGTVSATAETVGAAKNVIVGAGEAVNNLNDTATSWGGIGDFFHNVTEGNGMNMIGNLLGNVFSGKVSMMSMAGLVAAGMLIFGRFGWMGKIAGALLGMLLIGNNSKVVKQANPQQMLAEARQNVGENPRSVTYEEALRPVIRR